MGLSPRVRGNLDVAEVTNQWHGSIPARAGKPKIVPRKDNAYRVYPRACGETMRSTVVPVGDEGLSPRVRGNLAKHLDELLPPGSIPARAGKPRKAPRRTAPSGVYPRACGETCHSSPFSARSPGLSPRVRGNLRVDVADEPAEGSIPARAGKPHPRCPAPRQHGVYPRACGETPFDLAVARTTTGLSPRVRGNRRR